MGSICTPLWPEGPLVCSYRLVVRLHPSPSSSCVFEFSISSVSDHTSRKKTLPCPRSGVFQLLFFFGLCWVLQVSSSPRRYKFKESKLQRVLFPASKPAPSPLLRRGLGLSNEIPPKCSLFPCLRFHFLLEIELFYVLANVAAALSNFLYDITPRPCFSARPPLPLTYYEPSTPCQSEQEDLILFSAHRLEPLEPRAATSYPLRM